MTPVTKFAPGKAKKCMSQARILMLEEEFSDDNYKCHCLPACNSMEYEAEILKTDYNVKRFKKIIHKTNNSTDESLKGVEFSKMEMYFKKPRFLSMRRSELYGLIEFLAQSGGLLGLFLGFSFLSLIEIFYFLSLRLCCTLKKDLEEEKVQNQPGKEIKIEKY